MAFAAIANKFGLSRAQAWGSYHKIQIAFDFIKEQRKKGKCKKFDEAFAAIANKFGLNYARAWGLHPW